MNYLIEKLIIYLMVKIKGQGSSKQLWSFNNSSPILFFNSWLN